MNTKPEALRLADELEMWTLGEPAAAELRRLHEENEALHEANESFGKRQEWWNDRMCELEKQRDELLEALKKLLPMAEDSVTQPSLEVDILDARAAIAKVEGEKQ